MSIELRDMLEYFVVTGRNAENAIFKPVETGQNYKYTNPNIQNYNEYLEYCKILK